MRNSNKYLILVAAGALALTTYLGCPSKTASGPSLNQASYSSESVEKASSEPSVAESAPVCVAERPAVFGSTMQRIVDIYNNRDESNERAEPMNNLESSVRYTIDGTFVTPDMDVPKSETYASESEAMSAWEFFERKGREAIRESDEAGYKPGSALKALDDVGVLVKDLYCLGKVFYEIGQENSKE